MASADWTELTDSLDSGVLARGVTAGATPPNGGGTHVFGARTLSIVTGAYALFANQAGFAPGAAFKDQSVRAALKKGVSAGNNGFSAFIYVCAQTTTVAGFAYILGLSDGDPSYITLAKRRIVDGVPDAAPGSEGVLRRSSSTVPIDTWKHLRLDAVINTNGDVVLNCFMSDLVGHAVSAPSWVAIPGITQYIDDNLGANSGSAPLTSGRMGFGYRFSDTGRVAYHDHLECQVES